MINSRDRFTFEMLREPTLEDYALPPRFLRGEAKHWRPFRPIADGRIRPERRLASLTTGELAGLCSLCISLGFILGYYCAFAH